MTSSLEASAWPLARASEALEALGKGARLPIAASVPAVRSSVEETAHAFGLEADRLNITYADIDAHLHAGVPALLRIGPADAPRVIAVLRAKRGRLRVVGPDHTVRTIAVETVRDALYVDAERIYGARIDAILDGIVLSPKRRALGRARLLREQAAHLPLDAGWSVHISPSAPFRHQLRIAGITRTLRAMTLAHTASFLLSLASWWLIGRAAFAGHLERGWFWGWVLLLGTLIPIRVLSTWWQGMVGIDVGMLSKRRMLTGALELDTTEIRREGTGQLLARVIEADALEELALNGGFVSLVAIVELSLSGIVIALGPAGLISILLFLAWMALTAWLIRRFAVRWIAWSRTRLAMTSDVVEGMLGHRTRVVQEAPVTWHLAEDRALAAYSEEGRALDNASALITGLLPRGWLIVGLAGLCTSLLRNSTEPGMLAVGVGGLLLARNALVRLTAGATSLVAAYAAWLHAAPLYHAAQQPESRSPAARATAPDMTKALDPATDATLLDVRNLSFRYNESGKGVLRDVTLRVRNRDRILVEGPSGSGKSTLGTLMSGLRRPGTGLLLLRGLDRAALGTEAWRKRIAAAPQFHDNHIFADSFAFNLLMGRRWPPRKEDLGEAETICRELGLGPLLERMPGGLLQRVGETGWQLSHGERSRVYLARALLQGAELVILDESFASLDPETQAQALRCAMQRAPTLMVIAHP